MLVAYGLKLSYSRAAAEDLAWILGPTARAVGWLRGETLALSPGAGWMAPDGSYVIAPACAGVNFMILVLTVAVIGFAHRLRSPGQRLSWWIGSLLGAYILTIAVNTLRILAAVELYKVGPVTWLTREQEHRLLGTVLYLGVLWGIFGFLDKLTGQGTPSRLALLVPGAYLGMTVVVPLVNGHTGGRYAEHAMMVSGAVLAGMILAAVLWRRRDGQTDDPGRRG